ncbi:hypothetical protein SAMN02799624_03931 [Paenibacillus sp. UNC496MF]|uniref:hypothetical protein n=1 Tax=Paenibacillus sp. UNC496MF TaxID=1502753 RepID=UPI0008E65227|nr:hypothetical protein [Paenibacillus sp. UNC496MF]SFJ26930.1 hypothetical protein SAMN02799624_03931 [Paenibacillus sp. UNC496MF]
MSRLTELFDKTNAIMENLADVDYEQLVQLVELREEALADLQATNRIEEADKRIIHQLMACDEALLGRMKQLSKEASESLYKINFSKFQKRVYEPDYIANSLFFDKRK